jgi:adenylate cyclase
MSAEPLEPGAWLESQDGKRTPVTRTCSIGRSRNNQLVLPDMRVSRRHALIQMQMPGEYWVVDFGTVNGTRVDGRRIAVPTLLREGSRIEVGGNVMVFRQPESTFQGGHDTVSTTATMHDVRRIPVWLLVTDIIDSTAFYGSLPSEQLPQVIGQWFSKCRELMDQAGGFINQYLGDGFFGHWGDGEQVPDRVAQALFRLRDLQGEAPPHFRWVLHHGNVLAAGVLNPGEESMMGPDMHFVFRMEGVAKQLGHPTLISESAARRIGDRCPLVEVGRASLKGFEGESLFYALGS